MTSLSQVTTDWFSLVSVANELAAQHSNICIMFAVVDEAHFRNPPPRQLHLNRSATGGSCKLRGLFIRLAAIDCVGGDTGVKPQDQYVTLYDDFESFLSIRFLFNWFHSVLLIFSFVYLAYLNFV